MKELLAYPKLFLAIGCLVLSASSSSAIIVKHVSALTAVPTAPAVASSEGVNAGPTAYKTLPTPLSTQTSNKAAVCGDSEPDAGEECDDGNLSNGDGCDSSCLVEAGSDCTLAVVEQTSSNVIVDGSFEANDPAWTISGTAFDPRCTPALCGSDVATDGSSYLWLGGGQFENGNGGTATQTLVVPANAATLTFDWSAGSSIGGAICETPAADRLELLIDDALIFRSPNPCTAPATFVTEVIDLALAGVADGGSHTLTFRAFNPDTIPGELTNFFVDNVRIDVPLADPILPAASSCFVGVCGDGVFSSGETCDDGNSSDGDGCSSTCDIEGVDFVCSDPLYTALDFLPDGVAPVADAIVEGSLEDRRGRKTNAWAETRASQNDFLPICTEVLCPFISENIASDGIFYALFGANENPSYTTLSQTLTIPSSATTLNFDLLVAICDSADDELTVDIDGNEVFRYDCTAELNDYTEQLADITAFADDAEHTITFVGNTVASNGGNSDFFVDNIRIPLPGTAIPKPGSCFQRDTSCAPIETFNAGIPADWTVFSQGPDVNDSWGNTGDGTCLAANAAPLAAAFGDNLTTGTGGAACADSDATGQADIDEGGTPFEMDTYLCTNALDLATITGPSFSFNTYYASRNNQLNDNSTPGNLEDDFDDDVLEVLVGVQAPGALSISNYTHVGGVTDHEDDSLFLTAAQELSFSLEGTELEGASEGYVCLRYRGTNAWFAQIDNAGLRGENCALAPVDTDGDGVFDSTDNCTLMPNPGQEDTNNDGIGNRCDPDFDNNCIVAFLDIAVFPPTFNSAEGDPNYNEDFDTDTNGALNFIDYLGITSFFGLPPGPSANPCIPGLGT